MAVGGDGVREGLGCAATDTTDGRGSEGGSVGVFGVVPRDACAPVGETDTVGATTTGPTLTGPVATDTVGSVGNAGNVTGPSVAACAGAVGNRSNNAAPSSPVAAAFVRNRDIIFMVFPVQPGLKRG
jgi:hypothetical protein